MKGISSSFGLISIIGLTVLTFMFFQETVPYMRMYKNFYSYNLSTWDGIANFSLIPNETNRWDLGNWTHRWRDVFVSGDIYSSNLISCDTIDTDANGMLICGTDAVDDADNDPTNEIQNLQSVTDQGSTTTNGITVNSLIVTNGNVGIGTSSPAYKLDVYDGSNDVYGRIRTAKTDGIAGLNLVNDARSWVVRVNSDDKFQVRDATVGKQRLTIDSYGHIGINTEVPNTYLSVYKSGGSAADFFHLRDDTDTNDFYIYYDGTNYRFQSESSGGGHNWVTFTTDGKVGIKTTSPAYTLDVNGNAGVRGSLQMHGYHLELNTNGGNSVYATTDSGSNNYTTHITNKGGVSVEIDGDDNAGSYPDNDVFKVTSPSKTLIYAKASDGTVGINTNSPAYTLDVNGNTRVNGYLFMGNGYSLHTESSDVFKLIHDSSYVTQVEQTDVGTYDYMTTIRGDVTIEQNRGLYFKYSSSVIPALTPQSNSQLRLQTNYGYFQFGPANTGWCHLTTDRPAFYFNKPLVPSGAVRPYLTTTYDLGDSSHYWRNAYVKYLIMPSGGYIKGGKKHYINCDSFMYATSGISKSGSGEYIYTTSSGQVALFDLGHVISVGEIVTVKIYAYSYGDTDPTAIKIMRRTDNPSNPNLDYSVVTSTYTRTDRGSNALYTMNSFTVEDGYMYFLRIEFPASSYFRLYGISVETRGA